MSNTGHTSLRFSVFSEHVLFYLLLMPLAIANLDLDARQIKRMLAGAIVLAVVKAIMGLVEIALRLGKPMEGSARLTYYEPTANWVIMIALLAIVAALLLRVTRPRWILLLEPAADRLPAVLLPALVLDRSGARLVAGDPVWNLADRPAPARPASLAMAVAIWLLGSLVFRSNLPLVNRSTPLRQPIRSRPRGSLPDRRARERCWPRSEHPITGLVVAVPRGRRPQRRCR